MKSGNHVEVREKMSKFKSLNLYQKCLIIIMIAMTLIFSVLYIKAYLRVGIEYMRQILVHSQENGNTVYSGEIKGEQVKFVVSDDNSVMFYYGDESFGPYTVKEDPTVVLEDEDLQGIEIRYGDEIIMFRGGVEVFGDHIQAYSEDKTLDSFSLAIYENHAEKIDGNNRVSNILLPSSYTIYKLVNNPPLIRDGSLFNWFAGVFACIINVLSILFAEGWFRFGLMFTIRDAERAEPTDLEIAKRYFGWTIITIVALFCFVAGLLL